MLYGNSSIGYGYSPDRSKDTVSFDNYHDPFINASGSRATGYYYSPSRDTRSKPASTGWYDGAGRYHES